MKKILIILLLLLPLAAIAEPKMSPVGRDLIKRFEGCRLRAYKCPAGVWTIGYGNTSRAKEGKIITKATAEKYLIEDLTRFERHVNKAIVRKLAWHEFDALASLAFNCGYVIRNGLRDAVNLEQTNLVMFYMRKYVHAKKRVLPGLVRRREAEIRLYRFGFWYETQQKNQPAG